VKFSNLTKIFWPEEGYTKGDLIEFYRRISPWLMPYLNDRPLVLDRYPDGIAGKNFYQKNAPAGTPDWVRTLPIWSDDSQRDIEYFVCNDVETLLHIANLGAIPLHIWASRVSDLAHPDWSILDLDPKGRAVHRRRGDRARRARALRGGRSAGLRQDQRGRKGCTSDPARRPVHLRAGASSSASSWRPMLARADAEIATTERVIAARRGRVYIDALQNGEGKLLVAPFSVRPVPGARVSTAAHWKEVTPKLDATKFTIKNVVEKMRRAGDPLAPVLDQRIDLGSRAREIDQRGAPDGARRALTSWSALTNCFSAESRSSP
jgi:bifunctional non-homologous end joining protein LigD